MYILTDWLSHRLFNIAAPVTEVDRCSVLICSSDQVAYYHIMPANHHFMIALYSSIALTSECIIRSSVIKSSSLTNTWLHTE